MLFTSALWMARTDQMTEDHFFNGFPCEWNMIVPTLFLLDAAPWFAAFACIVLALTQLTNIKFLHPMQVRWLRPLTVSITILWLATVLYMTARHPTRPWYGLVLLIACPSYIVGVGVWRTIFGPSTPRPDVAARHLIVPAATRRAGLTEVPGLRVGHADRRGQRLAHRYHGGARRRRCGRQRRGARRRARARARPICSPAHAVIERVDAICLTGGSAYGLAAADGVMAHLAERDIGFRVGPEAGQVVPIVPTAVIFDLGRGGRFDRPARRIVRPPSRSAGRSRTDRHRRRRCRHRRPGRVAAGRRRHGAPRAAGRRRWSPRSPSSTPPGG